MVSEPYHKLKRHMRSHLSNSLRKDLNKRSLSVRTGDKVKILRGEFKGAVGTVKKVVLKEGVYIDGVTRIKPDGSKVDVPIHPSKIMILERK